jgi:hypothetical protein
MGGESDNIIIRFTLTHLAKCCAPPPKKKLAAPVSWSLAERIADHRPLIINHLGEIIGPSSSILGESSKSGQEVAKLVGGIFANTLKPL